MSDTSPLALIEIVDRDGQVRQSVPVARWPLRIGRAFDNDVVLADPHVAAHHLRIAPAASRAPEAPQDGGLVLEVLDTHNGALLGVARLAAGASAPLADTGEPVSIGLGRTRVRLRLPGHTVAPELPLVAGSSRVGTRAPLVLAALALAAGMVFNTWLDADPDNFARVAGAMAAGALMLAALWCGGWALLSRIFTRHAQLGWHVRVFVYAALAVLAAEALPALLGFAFDWPWIADYAFVAGYAIGGVALYFHLLAVEPSRPKLMRAVGAVTAVVGIGLALWFNQQRGGDWGEDLYMSHLLPPALRATRGTSAEALVERLADLQATLDRKAKEPPRDGAEAAE